MANPAKEYACSLPAGLVKKAEEELNEKPKWRSRDIQALRDMVTAHPGLTCPTDDAFLLKFLRARKFDYDRAYQLLINYYQIRAENADHLSNLKPSTVSHVIQDGVSFILPHRDKYGCRIMYFRPSKWDPNSYPIYDILRTNLLNMELVLQEEETQVNGVVVLGDMSGLSMAHARSMDRTYARLFTSIMQEGFPLRFKGMSIIREPTVVSYIFTIVRPFLKEKMQKRLAFFGEDFKRIHERFDPSILPEELNGSLGPADELAKVWGKKLEASESMFEEMCHHSLAVPRQIMKKKNDEAVDCLVGTYKKLAVD